MGSQLHAHWTTCALNGNLKSSELSPFCFLYFASSPVADEGVVDMCVALIWNGEGVVCCASAVPERNGK